MTRYRANYIALATTMEVPSLQRIKELTEHLYVREYVAIKNTIFPSTTDRLRAYQYGKEAQDEAEKLIKKEENTPLPTPAAKRKAAEEVWKYVRATLWNAFNSVRNMKLRSEYINKISGNATKYINQINSDELTPEQLEALAKEAVDARNVALEATRAKLARTSRYFSETLKREGATYDSLTERYSQRKFGKSFSELTDSEKSLVFGDIIEASGRSNTIVNLLSEVTGAFGIAALIIALGTIVWDVVTSNTPVLTAIRDVWVGIGTTAASFAGDDLATSAITAGLVAAGVTETVAAGVALVGGIVAGLLLAAVVAPLLGALFDLIANAFSLHIPPALMTSIVTALKVPVDSSLQEELTTPLS